MKRLLFRVSGAAFAAAVLVASCHDPAAEAECAPGFAACDPGGEVCDVDLGTNAQHCGTCGHACAESPNAAPACKEGVCSTACHPGFGDCDHDPANGCETPTAADPNNCGVCGKRCPVNTECSGGVCRAKCTAGLGDCDGSIANGCETVLASSTPNCGACGQACDPGLTCVDAKCVTTTSCTALVGRTPPIPNGVYRIDAPGGAFDAYCLVDPSADGGGWTLVAKVDGAKSTFAYGASVWTDAITINPTSLALDLTEAKLDAFTRVSGEQARIGLREGNGLTHWLVVDTPSKISGMKLTLPEAFVNGGLFTTNLGRGAWLSLMGSPDAEADCNREGWNVKAGTNSVRVGMVFAPTSSCASSSSFIGIGSKQAGVVAGNGHTGVTTRPAMAYILVR